MVFSFVFSFSPHTSATTSFLFLRCKFKISNANERFNLSTTTVIMQNSKLKCDSRVQHCRNAHGENSQVRFGESVKNETSISTCTSLVWYRSFGSSQLLFLRFFYSSFHSCTMFYI